VSTLPTNVEAATRLVVLWVRDLTDDWVFVKEEILTELDNEHRKLFTRRDERTKGIVALNEMELELVTLWKQLTNVTLRLRSFKDRRAIKWWKPPVDLYDER